MNDNSLIITANAPPAKPAVAAAAAPGFFDHFLSELNPLQYVPVVGTIYRAVTGDTIPETARFAGSLVVSGLTGGPVGIGINVATTALEHLLGIDPEKIGDGILAELGISPDRAAAAQAAAASAPAAASSAAAPSAPAPAHPAPAAVASGWSPAQLAAYGIHQTAGGDLRHGADTGADVLNGLELAQLQGTATAA